jgi:hypothetical protein
MWNRNTGWLIIFLASIQFARAQGSEYGSHSRLNVAYGTLINTKDVFGHVVSLGILIPKTEKTYTEYEVRYWRDIYDQYTYGGAVVPGNQFIRHWSATGRFKYGFNILNKRVLSLNVAPFGSVYFGKARVVHEDSNVFAFSTEEIGFGVGGEFKLCYKVSDRIRMYSSFAQSFFRAYIDKYRSENPALTPNQRVRGGLTYSTIDEPAHLIIGLEVNPWKKM